MNVAYFSNHFAQTSGHGIARYVKQLYKAIHEFNPNIHITPISTLKSHGIHNFDQHKKDSDLKILPWGRYITALSWGIFKRPYIELWLENSFDLVHVPALGYPVPTQKPYIVTVHDIGPLTRPEFFSKRAIRWMKIGFAHMVKKASGIICVSKATADEVILQAGNPIQKRIHIIHEGVDPLFISKPDLKCLADLDGLPPEGTPFCLAAGAISPRKNTLGIIKAFELLKDKIPHHLCLVGGTGWDAREVFEKFRYSEIADRIHHLGYVSDIQLHALYSLADILVYPSLFEGFGLPALEAMAAGCPVITSNISSLPEIAGDAALLIDPFDVGSIARAIHEVCFDKSRKAEMSLRGKERASSFSWEHCARQVVDVYKSVVSK